MADLTNTPTFAAIQNFSGLTGDAKDGAVFHFSREHAADVQIAFTSNPANITGSANVSNARFATSPGSAFRLLAGAGRAVAVRISFGKYHLEQRSFLPVNPGNGVMAAGFTLSGLGLNRIIEPGITVSYLDANNRVLSLQTIDCNGPTAYFTGYVASAQQAPIAAIEIKFQYVADGSSTVALDDLGSSNLVKSF